MRKLITEGVNGLHSIGVKILAAYWITTVVVIAATNAFLPDQLRRPALIRQTVLASLELNGRSFVDAYQGGGCAAVSQLSSASSGTLFLATPSGRILCGSLDAQDLAAFVTKVDSSGTLESKRYATYQLVALPVATSSGNFIVLLRCGYGSRWQVFGWIPGPSTFAISGGVTIVLAVLVTMPIRRLRYAARQIAMGRLDARVRWGRAGSGRRVREGDEIQGLVRDFNDMASRLQELVLAQRLLLRDVSHELRSPLSRLTVALELAREEGTGTMNIHLDRIEREANRLNNLIGQLMSLSYMDTIREVTSLVDLSLDKLVADILPDVQYEGVVRKCHITATLIQNCVIRGDPELLHRALENIVRNAIQYTPEHGVVKIDLGTREASGARHAVLRVTDNGPGVPEDELVAILRPFYRVDESRQASTGGFGIGLAIADRVVRLHEGEITARNSPDGGLTVEMSIPLVNSL
jgi:two-component system, OmpR family, sensor histidine kinase CpxA